MLWTIALSVLATLAAVLVAVNFKTAEKKLERRIASQCGPADPQFRREMSVMLGPDIIGGNRIVDLHNGREIFPAMLEAIASARQTICLETYIYWSGDTGRRFSEALSERARAGLAVTLILDWVGSLKMDDELLERMRDAGVVARRFRPLRWYSIGRLNNRTHRKLLIIDGRLGFTGGVGIADQWQGDAQDPEHWRDMHFRVEGPVVAQMQAAFNDNWIKTSSEVLTGHPYFPRLEPVGASGAQMFIASPASGSESMLLMVLMAIAAARGTIDLAAAYFVPDPLSSRALLDAARRGVRIRVIVPGRYIDSETVRLASKARWGELLEAGVEIHEYMPTMMHSKLLIIDSEMVSVGSTNFDLRSFELNDEASLNVYDRVFATQMGRVFERDLAHAQPYTLARWRRRPLSERLLERFVRPIRSQL